MTIQRITELTSEPETGKFYLATCVPLYVLGVRGGWWPVLLPSHRDPELQADYEHFHYDWRFVSKSHYESVLKLEGRNEAAHVFTAVAAVSIGPEITWRRLKCKRVPPPFPTHNASGPPNRLVRILEPKYQGRRLGACLTCPHKGISLKGQPVRDGKVVCPGHGLCFDVKSGKL